MSGSGCHLHCVSADNERCYSQAALDAEKREREYDDLLEFVHSLEIHPEYEYATIKCARKMYSDQRPLDGDDGRAALWECNLDRGDRGMNRFGSHEEHYFRRRIKDEAQRPNRQVVVVESSSPIRVRSTALRKTL